MADDEEASENRAGVEMGGDGRAVMRTICDFSFIEGMPANVRPLARNFVAQYC